LCTFSVSQCSGMQLLWDQLAALYMAPLLSLSVLKLLPLYCMPGGLACSVTSDMLS